MQYIGKVRIVKDNKVIGVKDKKKGFIKKYLVFVVAGVLLIIYGICCFMYGNQLNGFTSLGFGLLMGVSIVYNWKDDQKRAEELRERAEKTPRVSEELKEKVLAMKAKNQDIQAIKLVREETGMSLYDAKNYVDGVGN